MKIYKISTDLAHGGSENLLHNIKKEKLQEENAKISYESEKEETERSKQSIEDVATLSVVSGHLSNLLEGLSANPSLLKDYPGIKNQSEGWKQFMIQKILENSNTPTEALLKYWNQKLKRELEEQISGYFSSEGISTSKPSVKLTNALLQHNNCPSAVYEDFTEVLAKHPQQAKSLKDLVVIIDRPNFSAKALENLYKIEFFHQIPSIMKSIATHTNAPFNVAVNYVLQSNDVSKVNEISNIKAIEQVAKIAQNVVDFQRFQIEKLINTPNTSTEVLSIVNNLRKDIENKIREALTKTDLSNEDAAQALNSQFNVSMNNVSDDESLRDFIARTTEEIKTHPNAPFNNNGEPVWEYQGNRNEDFRKQSILEYYGKYHDQNIEMDKKILNMMEEFKMEDLLISYIYRSLKKKLSSPFVDYPPQ